MLTNVAGFDLPGIRIPRRERQTTTLEALEQNILVCAGDLDIRPIRFGDWPAGCEVRILEELGIGEPAILVDGSGSIHELPEWSSYSVVRNIVDRCNCDLLPDQRSISSDSPFAIHTLGKCPTRERWGLVEECSERGIRGPGRVIRITGDIHVGRATGLELDMAYLQLPGYQLSREQAIGDVPDRVLVCPWAGDLHSRLVEIDNLPLASGRFGIRFSERVRELWSPHPGAIDLAVGNREVSPIPCTREGITLLCAYSRHGQEHRSQHEEHGKPGKTLHLTVLSVLL